jgi:hypothetical protein
MTRLGPAAVSSKTRKKRLPHSVRHYTQIWDFSRARRLVARPIPGARAATSAPGRIPSQSADICPGHARYSAWKAPRADAGRVLTLVRAGPVGAPTRPVVSRRCGATTFPEGSGPRSTTLSRYGRVALETASGSVRGQDTGVRQERQRRHCSAAG